jgi:hypothetical protein
VRRSFLLLSSCLLTACVGENAQGNVVPGDQDAAAALNEANPVLSSDEASGPRELVPARYYVNPANRVDLAVVRENTEPGVTINGHYSLSMVSCGLACMSYWIVDRNTGAVIDVPGRPDKGETGDIEIIYDIQSRLDSDAVRIVYGPMDTLSNDSCWSHDFQLGRNTLSSTGASARIACPQSQH